MNAFARAVCCPCRVVPATVFARGGDGCYCRGVGKVREWTKRAVSKAVAPDWVPRVRIPVLPLWERVRLYGEAPPGALVERVPGGVFV